MPIQRLSIEEALASLHSKAEGLAGAEAERRFKEYGPNELEDLSRRSLLVTFLQQFVHFFALVLWVGAGMAFFAESRQPGQGMAALGWAIIGVIIVNGVFSFWQVYRAERAAQALQKLLPQTVKLRRDGSVRHGTPRQLVPGDVILLEGGDRVPADCRLIQSQSLRVNTATVTGESVPVARDATPDSSATRLLDSHNLVLAGTSVVAGEAEALVFATGRHTAFGEIAMLTQTTLKGLSPLQREVARLSRLVAIIALGLGAAFFIIGQWVGLSFWANLMFAIGIIVANVPEGLLPTMTLALAMGSQRMARRNALVRHLPAVETLGSTTVICTDKTGTLTLNQMTAKQIYLEGQWFDTSDGRMIEQAAVRHPQFFAVARLCHNLVEMRGTQTGWCGDPMEVALVELADRAGVRMERAVKTDEIPFDAQRMRLTTMHTLPDGRWLLCKGAPEVVVGLCHAVETATGQELLTGESRAELLEAAAVAARGGLRVLALAWSRSPEADAEGMERDLVLSGLVALEDPPRPDVPEAMKRCLEAGIKVIMVTGDHPQTALAIAREIGMVKGSNPVVITGEQLLHLSSTQLQLKLDAEEILFARVAADQKLLIVQALKRKREVVAVTGDGVNDAPALKAADIGVAMGLSGTDVAREAADIVLLDDHFSSIVAAVEEGRSVFANMRKFLTYILTSNVPELVPYLAFVLLRIPLPLTVIQILAVDLGTDMVPALGLGVEPPHPQVMKLPPRPRTERLVQWPLMVRAYLWLGTMQAAAAMAAYFYILHRGGWTFGTTLGPEEVLYRQATTGCLAAIIVMQVANVFICRSEVLSAFQFKWRSNPLLLWGVAVECLLILGVVYTPWGNKAFGTSPIALTDWLFIVPFAVAMLAVEESRKFFVRRRADGVSFTVTP